MTFVVIYAPGTANSVCITFFSQAKELNILFVTSSKILQSTLICLRIEVWATLEIKFAL